MRYPAIVYSQDDEDVSYADNKRYRGFKRYLVTVIDRDPDSELNDKVAELPYCGYDRRFVTDGLNHTVYNLYF